MDQERRAAALRPECEMENSRGDCDWSCRLYGVRPTVPGHSVPTKS